MHIRFHTTAAIVVLLASGAWVATGKYSFVGSEVVSDGKTTSDAAPAVTAETKAQPDAVQTVAYMVATPAPYERHIRLSGQTEADKHVTLVARTAGAITKLAVAEGDNLASGALVIALDGPDKRAAVFSAKSQFDTAVHQAEMNQQLFARGSLPELQRQTSVSAREAARSALEAAQAEVDRLEVHAPFAGIVDKVSVEEGAWVQPGTEVATLLSLDPIVVVAEINERDLQAVTKGSKASVVFGSGTTADGVVRYVGHQASGVTRTFPIEVAIPNPDAIYSVGMSAEVDLAAKTAPAVVLPRSVVTLDANGKLGVRVLNADDTVGFLKVEIVDDTPDGMVLSGIPDRTRIIVSGQNMVTDGQKVAATLAPAGSN